MGYRVRFLSLITAASLLLALEVVGQAAPQNDAGGGHGLVLVLSRDETPEPPDSVTVKECLANHPQLACVPLNLTIKNEGNEAILRFFLSCSDRRAGFDLLMPDGKWKTFPSSIGFVYPGEGKTFTVNLPSCGRNIFMAEAFWPGESYVLHLRLADQNLWLDTAFPAPDRDDGLPHKHQEKGYALLEGSGPHTIRAHRYIEGCTASAKLRPGSDPNPLAYRSLCVGGSASKLRFVLQSNELKLESESPH